MCDKRITFTKICQSKRKKKMIKLIVDGAADFTDEEVEKYGIEVIPIKVRFGEKEYEKIGGAEFYKKLKESKSLPTTSLINEQRYFNKRITI